MRRSIPIMLTVSLVVVCGFTLKQAKQVEPHAAQRERDLAGEPLFQAAVKAAKASANLADPTQAALVLDAIEAALKAGACPTRTLTEEAFVPLHTARRYRELIRDHTHQSEINMRLPGYDGKPLHVNGVVRDEQGHPVAGALVFVYHTDSTGRYNQHGMDESNPVIFGYMKTDAKGRYAYTTIRPGHYPTTTDERVEQHIHYEVTAIGFQKRTTRLGFADDPFWRDQTIPRWVSTITPNERGIDACECDISLERAGESTKQE